MWSCKCDMERHYHRQLVEGNTASIVEECLRWSHLLGIHGSALLKSSILRRVVSLVRRKVGHQDPTGRREMLRSLNFMKV